MEKRQNTTIIWEVSNMSKNISFDDYLAEQLKDPEFKAGFDAESAKLESAVALMSKRHKARILASREKIITNNDSKA